MTGPNRVTAFVPSGTVLFVVGMRINTLRAVHKWLPVMIAMPKMLMELAKHRELGMLGTPRTFISGRVVMVQQYWLSYAALEAYAKDPARSHLPAWRAFNVAARGNRAVGIFHETYIVGPGSHENIYANIDAPILMGAAVAPVAIAPQAETSRQRLRD